MKTTELKADITVSDGVAVICQKGTAAIRAAVLGEEVIDGVQHLYLDRRVAEPWVNRLGPYRIRGAVSSILSCEVAGGAS